jgi:hypothetical protein
MRAAIFTGNCAIAMNWLLAVLKAWFHRLQSDLNQANGEFIACERRKFTAFPIKMQAGATACDMLAGTL